MTIEVLFLIKLTFLFKSSIELLSFAFQIKDIFVTFMFAN